MTAGEAGETVHLFITGFLCLEIYLSRRRYDWMLGALEKDFMSFIKVLRFVAVNSGKKMSVEAGIMVKLDE